MELHFGFSYCGLLFLCMLLVPNIAFTRFLPADFGEYSKKERKLLLILERVGEAGMVCLLPIFREHDLQELAPRALLLGAALVLMGLYEVYWLRYIRSDRTMTALYRPLFGIPLPGAVLPVAAGLLVSVYGRNIFLFAAAVCLGIGHVGIHFAHWKEVQNDHDISG